MDFGELRQDADEEAVVPTGPFQFVPHGTLAGFQPCQVQRHALSGSVPGLRCRLRPIPMQTVLNAPMAPHDVVELFWREGLAQQTVAGFLADVALLASGGRAIAYKYCHADCIAKSYATPQILGAWPHRYRLQATFRPKTLTQIRVRGLRFFICDSPGRVAVTLPTAGKPGQSCHSCNQATRLLTNRADAGGASFNVSVPLADLGGLGYRHGSVVQKQLYVVVQTALIAFQSQGVVPALVNHPVSST